MIYDKKGVINTDIPFPEVPNLHILSALFEKMEKIGDTQYIVFSKKFYRIPCCYNFEKLIGPNGCLRNSKMFGSGLYNVPEVSVFTNSVLSCSAGLQRFCFAFSVLKA